MGTTPPTYACAIRSINFGAETKFEKGASDRNSRPGDPDRFVDVMLGFVWIKNHATQVYIVDFLDQLRAH